MPNLKIFLSVYKVKGFQVGILFQFGVIAFHIICFALMSCSQSESREQSRKIWRGILDSRELASGEEARVDKVVDGDTFWVTNNRGVKVKIRLIGIDAPESKTVFEKKKHPFGPVSKKYLSNMILNREIRLEFDVDSLDRYGRTLAYAYFDGIFINQNMIKNGYATLMTVPPNVKYASRFVDDQNYARSNQLGIWGFEVE